MPAQQAIPDISSIAFDHLCSEDRFMTHPSNHTIQKERSFAVTRLVTDFTNKVKTFDPNVLQITSGVWVHPTDFIEGYYRLSDRNKILAIRDLRISLATELRRGGLRPHFVVGAYRYRGSTVDPYINEAFCIMIHKCRFDDPAIQEKVIKQVYIRFLRSLGRGAKTALRYTHPISVKQQNSAVCELTERAYQDAAQKIQDLLCNDGYVAHVSYSTSARRFVCEH